MISKVEVNGFKGIVLKNQKVIITNIILFNEGGNVIGTSNLNPDHTIEMFFLGNDRPELFNLSLGDSITVSGYVVIDFDSSKKPILRLSNPDFIVTNKVCS